MNSINRLFFLIITLCSLIGCGQKGPLYLPKPKPPTEEQPVTTTSSTTETPEETSEMEILPQD